MMRLLATIMVMTVLALAILGPFLPRVPWPPPRPPHARPFNPPPHREPDEPVQRSGFLQGRYVPDTVIVGTPIQRKLVYPEIRLHG